MKNGVKAIFLFGGALVMIGFAAYVPFWSSSIIDLANAPVQIQQLWQAAFVVLFFGFLMGVISSANK